MNNSTTYSRTMFGLTEINADVVNTGTLTATTIQAPTFKTNLVQSINNGDDLTLESLGASEVYIRSNGTNIGVFDRANNLITLNARVSQVRSDNATSYGVNCCLAPTGTTQQLTAYGNGALRFIQGGNYNSAFGQNALRNVSSGSNNAGFGTEAGLNITTGVSNMCIGLQSCSNVTSGNDNVGVGTQSGTGFTTGSQNISIGTRSGLQTTTFQSNNNVSIGFEAGQGIGAFGGNSNTMIGFRAGNTAFTAGWFNSTCIGAASQITASSQITLGRSSEYVCCPGNLVVGKTANGTNRMEIEGNSLFNGIVSVRNGNNLRIFNNGNTRQTNCYMLNDDLYINNTAPTGTITFQINTSSICSVSSSAINSNVYITVPLEPPLSSNSRVANTEYVDDAVATAITGLPTLSGANAWTGNTNTFNSFLPTSTINPTTSNQFCRKGFCDTTYASLASSNTFTGLTNTFNSSVQFGTQAPTCSFAPTLNSSLANKEYVDKNAIVPPTKLFTLTEDFWTGTGGAPGGGFGVSVWATTGTGGATHGVGTNINHVGVWTLTNNRSVYNTDAVYSGVPKQVIWIVRETTALNTFNWYAGIIESIGVFGNSAFIGHTSGGTTFFASVNNVNLYNFTSVTWAQNKWYEIKIDFNNPDVTFTLTNLTDNITESYTATASAYNFARNNTLAFQHVSVSGTNTAEVDYVSMSYQCNRT